jgi:hypothetical protein
MGTELFPGNLKPIKPAPPNPPSNATDYSLFTNSMADEIEQQLNTLMVGDDLPALSFDVNDRTVRDRRRLFVAIARGVCLHLANNKDAFDIFCVHGTTVHPTTIHVK